MTYPEAYRSTMNGQLIKDILEDVADNLFNPDPYYQQGGDMMRVGGIQYAMDPTATIGERISAMELGGKPIEAAKTYRVAGWASVAEPLEGKPVWDVVAEYLRAHKTVSVKKLSEPTLKNVSGNPGLVPL